MNRLALAAFVVLVLAGCARTTPPYLCMAGRLDSGAPAMLCHPVNDKDRP